MKTFNENEVTPEHIFFNRRKFMAGAGAGLGATLLGSPSLAQDELTPTAYDDITSYNNYYEFGLGKSAPKDAAQALTIDPWSIEFAGEFDKAGTYSLEEVLDGLELQNRTYRFRCVEAWAMVVPWNGYMLKDILTKFGVNDKAKYVQFETIVRESEMPGTQVPNLDWPYREGLRIDEAMHPLTLMATGIYDKPIPKQNGAPIRLVVPWKYGFKSAKAIVKIVATEEQPYTTWNAENPNEYGFYANVNPNVSHPRWSQASERVIGGGLLAPRQETLMFNGYDEVASLYEGMDLTKDF